MTGRLQSPSLFWGRLALVVLVLASAIAVAFLLVTDEEAEYSGWDGLDVILVVGVLSVLYCLVRLYIALGGEACLDPSTRQRLRRRVLVLGPAGALEVLLELRKVLSD